MDIAGEGEDGTLWESSTDIDILSSAKQWETVVWRRGLSLDLCDDRDG